MTIFLGTRKKGLRNPFLSWFGLLLEFCSASWLGKIQKGAKSAAIKVDPLKTIAFSKNNAPSEIILQTCQNECKIMHLLTIVSGLMEPKLLTYSLHSTSVATPVKMQELLGAWILQKKFLESRNGQQIYEKTSQYSTVSC